MHRDIAARNVLLGADLTGALARFRSVLGADLTGALARFRSVANAARARGAGSVDRRAVGGAAKVADFGMARIHDGDDYSHTHRSDRAVAVALAATTHLLWWQRGRRRA